MKKKNEKLTTRNLEKLSRSLKRGEEAWDPDVSGYHVRAGSRGLALRFSYYNEIGKRRVISFGRYGELTAAEAREFARESAALVARGGDPRQMIETSKAEVRRNEESTVGAYLESAYHYHQSRMQDGKGTLGRIRRDFACWMDRPMASLTRFDVEEWQSYQEKLDAKKEQARIEAISKGEKPKKGKRTFQTLKRAYDAIHAMLEHAASRGIIDNNPLSGVKLQPYSLSDGEEKVTETRRHLRGDETEWLFKGLHLYNEKLKKERRNSRAHGKKYLPDLDLVRFSSHHVPLILFMYYTGFRQGDIFELRWEHLDFENHLVRKVISKTKRHHPAPMTFPMSSELMRILSDWYDQSGSPVTGLVFPSPVTGKMLTSKAMDKSWISVKELGGLPEGLHMYSLRHNFASQLVMSGVDLVTVSKLMAHTNIETTVKYYSHLSPGHTKSAVEKMAKFYS